MSQYALNTRFDARPDKGDELLGILVKANQIVSVAKGCRLYMINHEADNKDIFWVTELWDSQEEHAISLTLDGCKELIVEASHILAGEPKQIVLVPVAGKGVDA
ncbi:MAG: antibiotic biosynthesis monooxygenase [Bacteroidota bacterium]